MVVQKIDQAVENHVLIIIDNEINCGLLSFRHLEMCRNTQENSRNTQIRFMFLTFPFVCRSISVYLKLNRPWLVIVYCYI